MVSLWRPLIDHGCSPRLAPLATMGSAATAANGISSAKASAARMNGERATACRAQAPDCTVQVMGDRVLEYKGLDEPPSSAFHPIFNYVSSSDFYTDGKGWTSLSRVVTAKQDSNQVRLTVEDNAGKKHPLIIIFYTPSVFRLRFDPFSDKPYTDSTGSGYSYAVVDDRKGAQGKPEHSYALLKEKPEQLDIEVTESDTEFKITVQGPDAVELLVTKKPYGLTVLDARTRETISSDVKDGAVRFKVIGQDKGDYRGTSIDRTVGSTISFREKQAGARYYGCGQKSGFGLNKDGAALTFFNYDNYAYDPDTPSLPLYISVPLLLEVTPTEHALGVFLDNPGQTYFNLGADNAPSTDTSFMGALFGELNLYFIYGGAGSRSLSKVVSDYTALTGRIPLPPTFALGYQQACYGYKNEQLVFNIAETFRAKGIPCDGIHIDVDFADRYKTFTYNPDAFPEVYELFEVLSGKGFKCANNTVPKVTINAQPPAYEPLVTGQQLDVFVTDPMAAQAYNNEPYFVGQQVYGTDKQQNLLTSFGYYPDFTKPENRAWWGGLYSVYDGWGLQMVWQDEMCPGIAGTVMKTLPLYIRQYDFGRGSAHGQLHNVYGQTMIQGTYEGLEKIYVEKAKSQNAPPQRPFIIARGGYAGGQRYAAHWTGDNVSSWEHYRMNFPMVINMALSGYAIAGANIGGFASGPAQAPPGLPSGTCPPDLLSRWITGASFLPWFQVHYNGYLKPFQEPWCYGADVERVCKRFILLRYELIQLWSDLVAVASRTGIPPARALFLAFPEDARAYDHADDQFMVGEALLVAPVVKQDKASRSAHDHAADRFMAGVAPLAAPVAKQEKVYLPSGPAAWYKITDALLSGSAPLGPPLKAGSTLADVAAPLFPADALEAVPLYAPAGALLPTRLAQQYFGDRLFNPLTLFIFPGGEGAATSTYVMSEDDGLTVAYKEGQVRTTEFTLQPGDTGGHARLGISVGGAFADRLGADFWYFRFLGVGKDRDAMLGSEQLQALTLAELADSPTSAIAYDSASGSLVVKAFYSAVPMGSNTTLSIS